VVLGTLLLCVVPCTSDAANPIQKVLELLASMQQKIIKDAEERHKGYVEFAGMCEDRAREITKEIKKASLQVEDLQATIEKASDDEAETTTSIEELSATLSNSEADLKAAANIRQKESGDFAENQKDLVDTIGQMERAISIIEKQMKGGASLAQLPVSVQKKELVVQKQRAAALAEAFAAMIDSSSLDSADTERLASLIQTSEGDSDSESAAATQSDAAELDAAEESYTAGTGGPENPGSIVETLENLLEKAQAQLDTARTKETKSRHNYELFKGALERKLAVARKDMNNAKGAMGEAGQSRAKATGDLEVTNKDLAEDKVALNELHHECMHKAADFEEETKARGEELKALATAKKVIKEMTGAAEDKTYDSASSFVQVRAKSSSASPSIKALRAVKELGKTQHMPILLDLAHQLESVIRNSAISGADPFAKVKGMINSMLGHLTKQMEDEASHKAYCDKEMSDTTKSKDVKEGLVDKLTTRIDTQSSASMSLKEQVSGVQKELFNIMKIQEELDAMRKQEHALFSRTKPELQQGQEGIKKALQVLRQYYSQDDDKPSGAQDGAGGTIIGLLEVVESDFAKGIANMQEEEESSQAQYEKQTNENKVEVALKQEEVTFKTKEIKGLSKSTAESSSDLDGVQTELDAVNEYYRKIQEECVAKPEPYEERRKRQDTTLQGLQDALQILGGGAALDQQSARRLRGTMPSQ